MLYIAAGIPPAWLPELIPYTQGRLVCGSAALPEVTVGSKSWGWDPRPPWSWYHWHGVPKSLV